MDSKFAAFIFYAFPAHILNIQPNISLLVFTQGLVNEGRAPLLSADSKNPSKNRHFELTYSTDFNASTNIIVQSASSEKDESIDQHKESLQPNTSPVT